MTQGGASDHGAGRTLVIIPAFNEEAALPAVLADLRLTRPDLDVVVVDDGSADSTSVVAAEHGATVLTLPFNLGVGGALRTGFRYATRHGYDAALQFDADGQHDPSEIATLLAVIDDGVDMVIGSRFADERNAYDVGRVRAGAMAVMRVAVRQLSGRRFTDTTSGFRAFSRPVLELFAQRYPDEYLETVESLLLACAHGFTVEEVPVQMHARQAGQPSTRHIRLLYHYVRVLFVVGAKTPRRRPGRTVNHPAGASS
jgi:glycosyltransferase involved in cell wall biosynthesis